MHTMTTVSEVLDTLKTEGYLVDFNLNERTLAGSGNLLLLHPQEFIIDKHFRFEGISDPDDEAVVYAISSASYHLKGTLVNGYGIYSDSAADAMVRALHPPAAPAVAPAVPAVAPAAANAATPQRPTGTRPLDAPLLAFDLPAAAAELRREPAWHSSDRNARTLVKTPGLCLVLMVLRAGAELKTHTAVGPISVQVLEGNLTFFGDGQAVALAAGHLLALHPGLPHRVLAHTDAVFLLALAAPAAPSAAA